MRALLIAAGLLLLLVGCDYDPKTRSKHVSLAAPKPGQVTALGRVYDQLGSGPSGELVVQATVGRVGGGGFELKNAPPGANFLRTDAQTRVVGAQALEPGMEVRATYDVQGFDAKATNVEVVRGQAAGRP